MQELIRLAQLRDQAEEDFVRQFLTLGVYVLYYYTEDAEIADNMRDVWECQASGQEAQWLDND